MINDILNSVAGYLRRCLFSFSSDFKMNHRTSDFIRKFSDLLGILLFKYNIFQKLSIFHFIISSPIYVLHTILYFTSYFNAINNVFAVDYIFKELLLISIQSYRHIANIYLIMNEIRFTVLNEIVMTLIAMYITKVSN